MTSDSEYLLRKNRILSRALIASAVINIVVLALFSYWITRERPPTPYCELKPKKHASVVMLTNPLGVTEHITQLSQCSFLQLVELLKSPRPIGQSYLEKDLALACLVAFHHFDLSRALKPLDLPQQKHFIKLIKDSEEANFLTIYPNLNSQAFNTIIKFASTERWPMTAQGLFLILKKQSKDQSIDSTLIETFALTPEFWSMELLLSRADQSITRNIIAELLVEGNWEILKQFAEQQSKLNDLSDERRRKVLLDYVHAHSKKAAELLLKLDADFTLKKLNDQQILAVLHLLSTKTNDSERFAKELLASPRSIKVWQKATERLYGYAGEQVPENWDYQRAIARFVYPIPQQQKRSFPAAPLLAKSTIKKSSVPLSVGQEKHNFSRGPTTAVKTPSAIAQNSKLVFPRFYTVQSGDSLWKISRKFNVNIDKIKEANRLSSDSLKPGIVLKIPDR